MTSTNPQFVYKATNNPNNALRIAEQLEAEGLTVLENRKASAFEITEKTGQERKRAGYLVIATSTPELVTQYPDTDKAQNTEKEKENDMDQIKEIASNMPSEDELPVTKDELPENLEEAVEKAQEELSTEVKDVPQKKEKKAKKAKGPALLTNEEAQQAFLAKYPHVVPGTFLKGGIGGKDTVTCVCQCGCGETMLRNVQDVFQSGMCGECRRIERNRKRREKRAQNKAAKDAAKAVAASADHAEESAEETTEDDS